MAATVKIKGLKTVLKKLKNSVNDIANKKTLKEVEDKAVDLIVGQARKGINARTGKSLPRLSDSYIATRQGAIKFRTINGNVVPFDGPDPILRTVDPKYFDPGRSTSNLTFTGKLLDAIIGNIDNKANTVDIIVLENRSSKEAKNAQILKFLERLNKGYDFIGLDKKGRAKISKIINRSIKRETKKFNK